MLNDASKQSQSHLTIAIGEIQIPYLPLVEKRVQALIQEYLPVSKQVPPILERFGLTKEKIDPFFCQLFLFPRVLTNRDFSIELNARQRVDLAKALVKGIEPNSFNPSQSTLVATAWSHLYFKRIGASADESRVEFLERIFGSLPKIEGAVSALYLPQERAAREIAERLSAQTADTEPLSLPPPPEVATVERSKRRAELMKSLYAELENDEFLISDRSEFRTWRILIDDPYSAAVDVLNEFKKGDGSRLSKRYARIVRVQNDKSYVVKDGELSLNSRRDFRVEYPTSLYFETPSFGMLHVFSTNRTMFIQGDKMRLLDLEESSGVANLLKIELF